jgi:hypothetical protein
MAYIEAEICMSMIMQKFKVTPRPSAYCDIDIVLLTSPR